MSGRFSKINIFLIPLALLSASPLIAAVSQADSLGVLLDTARVSSRRNTSHLHSKAGEKYAVDISLMNSLPQILGSADPIHYLQYFPGVQTTSELDSGIHIQGCDNAHNDVCIDGVSVYGASHLFGLFSVFNTSHFKGFELDFQAKESNRLGGFLNMIPNTVRPSKTDGEIRAGLMFSQGSLGFPIGKNLRYSYLFAVHISMRYTTVFS